MTESEEIFEAFMTNHNVSFEKIPEASSETPDYWVSIDAEEQYWEVKELEENDKEKAILRHIEKDEQEIYSVNSQRVQNSIIKASSQFKAYEVTDKPCVVALYDSRDFFVRDLLFFNDIRTAMLGSADIMYKNNIGVEVNRRPGLLTHRKKYVSAIVVLSGNKESAYCFHNPNATIPIVKSGICKIFKGQEIAVNKSNGLVWENV